MVNWKWEDRSRSIYRELLCASIFQVSKRNKIKSRILYIVVEWFKAFDWRCEDRGFESRHGTNILWHDIKLHLLLSTQVLKWVPGRMRPLLLVKQFLSVKSRLAGMLPREWRLSTQCVRTSTKSNDRGNSISVKRLETSEMY